MSIPRVKIVTHREGYQWGWECECGVLGKLEPRWDYAQQSAATHLSHAHKIRAVGTLTVADVGRWIELADPWVTMPFQITQIQHNPYGTTAWGWGADGWSGRPTTPCRVTDTDPITPREDGSPDV